MREANPEHRGRSVITGARVRRLEQPVLVDCGGGQGSGETMTVIPLMDGDRVAGIEVRCRCGAGVLIEHVLDGEQQR